MPCAVLALALCFIGSGLLAQVPPPRDEEGVPRHEMVDLVAERLAASPAYPLAGEKVALELTVANRSDNPAKGVAVTLLAEDKEVAHATVDLGARASAVVRLDWTPATAGRVRLLATVDPDRRFVEEQRADNTVALDTVVTEAAPTGADFAVTGLELVPGAPAGSGSSLRATVVNNGAAARGTAVVFTADGRVVGVSPVGALAPRATATISVPYAGEPPHRVTAEINPRFRNAERNPADNLLARTIAPPVDIRVEGLSVAAAQFERSRPRRVTISFRIVNGGTGAITTPFRTSIFPGKVNASGELAADDLVIPALQPGGAVYSSRTITSPSGEFDVRIEADVDRVTADANRANNVATSHFKNPVPDVDRWVSIGPRRIDNGALGAVGVLFRIAIDPTAPATLYVSAPRSGIWKTTDEGANWQPITDALPSLLVGAIALDPSNPSRLYAATTDFGVFRSDDGGANWTTLDTSNAVPNITQIETLLVMPSDPNRLLMTSPGGVLLHQANDPANKWVAKLNLGPATDLVLDPASPNTVFATLGPPTMGGSAVGIFRSSDAGMNWTKLGGCPGASLPATDGVQKITLSFAGGTLYAGFKSADKFEVWRTTTIGCSIGGFLESGWERRLTISGDDAKLLWNRIDTDPADPRFVYISGTNFRFSSDGGASFTVAPEPHADHHALAASPADPKVIYTACDGGLYRSSNRGASGSWQFLGDGIVNVQFYASADALTDPGLYIGGTQDNGTLRYTGSTVWDEINDGDGASVAIDPTNAQIQYSMHQGPDSMAKRVGNGPWACIACGLPLLGAQCQNLKFQLHPGSPATVLASCVSLWQAVAPVCTRCPDFNDNDVGAPNAWSEILPQANVTGKIVTSAVDPSVNLYYAGTNAGQVWAGPAGANWQLILSGSGAVTDIERDLDDPAVVYVATGSRVYRLRRSSPAPTGSTVQVLDITANLASVSPAVSINALAVDRMNPFTVFAATTRSVWRGRSTDGGATWVWHLYGNGLPLTDIRDLQVHPVTGAMRAVTFGRSAYEINTGPPVGSLLGATGKITFLRVNDVGTGFGPPIDFLDAEAIVQLDSQPGKGFGFQLRTTSQTEDHAGMLRLLRSAFSRNKTVALDYIRTGIRNGRIIRVAIVE
jgi:hypothetical protein